MHVLRQSLRAEFVAFIAAGLTTIFAAYVSMQLGSRIGLGLVLVVFLFLVALGGFLFWPHVTVAVAIPVFALVPMAKVFFGPWVGPLKDLISLAAIAAALLLLVVRHQRPQGDSLVLGAIALLVVLYLFNVAGSHNIAWLQGVRLASVPLLLLGVGMTLDRPRQTLRWAIGSLVTTACFVAFYGLLQQYLGRWRLQALGYSFTQQLRDFHGYLRSFGTLDDPFAYAALLLLALAAVMFWMKPRPLAIFAGVLITAGIMVSFVRSAILIGLALIGLWLARKGKGAAAALLFASVVVLAGLILGTATAQESRSYQTSNSIVTLNGRVGAWKTALGKPSDWPFGQGVGEIGTAAQRATYTITPRTGGALPDSAKAVDSGYLATIADVGFAGLIILLVLFGRIGALSLAAIRNHQRSGWLAAALLAVITLDAVTRSSFTGFPTASLSFLLIGLALATASEAGTMRSRALNTVP